MVQARKWVYAHEYDGQPQTSNLQLVTENIPDTLQDGEVLCEAVFLSVDPYMRLFKVAVGDVMQGEQVARVTASKSESFPVGTMVLAKLGWRTHTIVSDTSILEQLPPLGDLPASLALGTVGMPGMTAYFGVEEILKLVKGETVLVNAAAGAVGSVVGQMAKIKGCKVIGYAGTKEKCDWLKSELGFDTVFNYKEVKLEDSIKKAAPEGVDCYFDNFCQFRLFKVGVGDVMQGEQVARVTASKSESFPVGTMVLAKLGWRTHTIVSDTSILEQLPPLGDLPASLALGTVGMPGMTAYFGVEEILKLVKGETVLVNAAAGAVGSVVGQMAKIKGCKVIGYAGTKEKCDWLKSELGFDTVFNYKEVKLEDSIKKAAPEGVDCYFDNVGGEFSSTVLFNMKQFGRIAVCGQIDQYRYDGKQQTGPLVYGQMLAKQLTMKGFMCRHYFQHWPEAKLQVIEWIKQGKIKYRETITEGFENMAEAFVGLFHGANIGKAIVKV